MDRKAVSFFSVGLAVGIILTVMLFSWLGRGSGQEEGAAGKVVLKLAHVLDQSHPVHLAMENMAEELDAVSGGLMELQIFPNGQLGSETDSIEQVQKGVLAMVKTSTAPLEGFIPDMALFGLPYLFRDSEHYWNVLLGDVGEELLAKGSGVGLKGLIYYDSGSRSFYTIDSPVLHPDDLRNKKIRVMRSKTSIEMISTMGGSPTPIPFGELYTALQQGMVDGAENNPPSVDTSRHYEVAKHYSLDEHSRIPDIVLFSQKIWDDLTPQQQRWMQEAANRSVTFQRELWKVKTQESLDKLEAAGVTVYYPEKEPFREKVRPMYDALKGTSLYELIERVEAVQ
ncbi:MAG: TRAP transporter substrate-binding protein [Puniceicoccaceae bacterium]